jgi:hypothetical protein
MYLFLVQEVRGEEDLAPAGLRVGRPQLPLHLPALPRLQVCCAGIGEGKAGVLKKLSLAGLAQYS